MQYNVVFEEFTQRHFIKSFEKKYKGSWELTYGYLIEEFKQIDILFLKSVAETIFDSPAIKICKTEFKIAGTQDSRHSSGNRCIVAIHKDAAQVRVLLVYGKTDIASKNETAVWKGIIKDNYPQYKGIIN
jgi:hypothetical protein